ncbi:MAG: polysaccharide biosynthesis/export family protein [Pseudomonadota bacterium]
MTRFIHQNILRLFGAMFAMVLVAACQSTPGTSGETAVSSEREAAGEYRLGTDDEIRVSVFGHDDLSGQFIVSNSGTVSLPLIGEVQAAGLTITEFITATETSLKDGYLKEPRVSAQVLNFRPYYILGEVNNPGEYPYSTDLTVLKAIATAGGFTYRANKREVMIKEIDRDNERKILLTPTTDIQPGDTIRVLERFF